MRRNRAILLKLVIAIIIVIVIAKWFTSENGSGTDVYVDDIILEKREPANRIQSDYRESEMKKIDWHDYKKMAEDKEMIGPGEQGQAVILDADEEKKKLDLYKANGFNAYVSDKISLHRSLKDIRHPDCNSKTYWNKLPNVSVIVPFHNEHWSTLLRTVWSVLDRAPPELIKEVILVDDFSDKEFLGKQLEDYLQEHFTNVRVIRAKKREGLIRTRILGALAATGKVLIFLDSHCEASVNWLPPLLSPIQEDYKTVVCPFIDVIDYETFAYRAQDNGARGAFNWEFLYKRLPLTPDDLKHPSEPFKSPVMAGGLFAISAKWFWELGGYDAGLEIWGAEQYELSFKIWQCGGQMIDTPCSRIGHVYTKFKPYTHPGPPDYIWRNYKRVAEVWMDEYAQYLYKRRPNLISIDTGDLTAQKAIRQKLNCKPFKWFMKEIAFDLEDTYPAIEPTPYANGEIRNVAANMCIDTRFKNQNERFTIEPCIKDGGETGGEQNMVFSWHKDIRPSKRNVCFDVTGSMSKAVVLLYQCHGQKGNQRFKYNIGTKQILHVTSNQCLDCDPHTKELFMNPCDQSVDTQKWTIEHVDVEKVQNEWHNTN